MAIVDSELQNPLGTLDPQEHYRKTKQPCLAGVYVEVAATSRQDSTGIRLQCPTSTNKETRDPTSNNYVLTLTFDKVVEKKLKGLKYIQR